MNTETLAIDALRGTLSRRGVMITDLTATVASTAAGEIVATSRCSLSIVREGTANAYVFPDLLFRVTIDGNPNALFVLVEIDEVGHVFYDPSCEAARIQRIAFDAPAIPPNAHLLVVRFSTAQLRSENASLHERADAVAAAIASFIEHRTLASSSSPSRASVLFCYYPIEARPNIDALADKNAAGVILLPTIQCDHPLAEPREIAANRECDNDYADAITAHNEALYPRAMEAASARSKKRKSDGGTPAKKK